jgi:hypothetical protein
MTLQSCCCSSNISVNCCRRRRATRLGHKRIHLVESKVIMLRLDNFEFFRDTHEPRATIAEARRLIDVPPTSSFSREASGNSSTQYFRSVCVRRLEPEILVCADSCVRADSCALTPVPTLVCVDSNLKYPTAVLREQTALCDPPPFGPNCLFSCEPQMQNLLHSMCW